MITVAMCTVRSGAAWLDIVPYLPTCLGATATAQLLLSGAAELQVSSQCWRRCCPKDIRHGRPQDHTDCIPGTCTLRWAVSTSSTPSKVFLPS